MATVVPKPVKKARKVEPVIFWTVLNAVCQVIIYLALPISPPVHIAVVVVSVIAQTALARRDTVPATSEAKLTAQLETLHSS